ncbi:transposase [Rhizobium lentis]|uniref:transposase n=1 Tax=Rhizobium lentis TaxID=1138194 RepID=UPI001616A253
MPSDNVDGRQIAFDIAGSVQRGWEFFDVARRHDVLPQQIYAWRKKFSPPELKFPETLSFVPVSLVGGSESVSDGSKRSDPRSRCKDVEIVLRNGRVLRIAADMDLEVLSSLVACVEAA